MKEITKINKTALASFGQIISLSNQLQDANQHRNAEWFDTEEKRMQWWMDLEAQWRRAFCEAVWMREPSDAKSYLPSDEELQLLFEMDYLGVCGNGNFTGVRNNNPDISFQLDNLSGLKNLTNLKRVECDYNGLITSLEPLRYLKKLQTLWCDNNQISDLSPLMELYGLTDLCCWNNQIRSLEPLASMVQIHSLTLELYGKGNPIESLEPLKHIVSLRYLYLTNKDLLTPELKRALKNVYIF